MDGLTGYYEKAEVEEILRASCETDSGILMVLNLDNSTLFADVYGDELSERLLLQIATIINMNTAPEDIRGRIDKDEFVIFCRNQLDMKIFANMTTRLNNQIIEAAKALAGEDMRIPIGASIGAILIPEQGRNYDELYSKAVMVMEYVKQNGNHGCAFYTKKTDVQQNIEDMEVISRGLDEQIVQRGAMWLEQDYFSIVYRYIRRYIKTYGSKALKVLVTIKLKPDYAEDENFERLVRGYGLIINSALRRSDIMMQSKKNQFFLLLPELDNEFTSKVMTRLKKKWYETGYDEYAELLIENKMITPEEDANQ